MIVLPPTAPDAEVGALGCLLLDPANIIPQARRQLTDAKFFNDERNQYIYRTLLQMQEKGQHIDLITFSQRAKDDRKLEDIGGPAYLAALQDSTPSASNFEYYALILIEKHQLRELLQRANEIVDMVGHNRSPAEILARWSDGAVELSGNDPSQTIKELANAAYDSIIESTDRVKNGESMGLRVGIRSLDQKTRGFNPKELVVIAGRPSMGKTSAMLSIARGIAMQNKSVAYFSFEDDCEVLTKRLTSIEASLNLQRPEEWTDDDYRSLLQAKTTIGKWPILFRHLPTTPIDVVCALATGLHHEHKLSALILDYLGLMLGVRDHYSDKDRINEVLTHLVRLKNKLKIPIFLSQQLSRDSETEKRPKLRHLKDSGNIEQSANTVMFLHQEGSEKQRAIYPVVTAIGIIEKRRDGETGECEMQFRRYCGRWEDLPLDSDAN